ncbi:ATP-binding protein [Candidatus Laterigemmans baculatus]|uniref:hypothetical protein n=1 Tax=Candidatus Laterigemmans baculatus TaxID=2770505 RepID=UPI0013DBF688|nr:hypothetical protein [Candidatus Laterigemmans baculatus]
MRLCPGSASALLATLLAVAIATPSAAQPPREADQAGAPPLSDEELAERFDARSYAERERTMRQLWGDYERSRERVRKLAASNNLEVAERAEWILRRWEIGLMPELPDAVRRDVAEADGQPALALTALLEAGYLREAVEVARQQTRGAAADEIRGELGAVVARRYLGLLDAARQSDSLDLVLELLDHTAESTPLAVARALLLDRLGRVVDESNLLPACAARWTPARRQEVTVIAWTVLGRFDEAIAAAEQANRSDLLVTVLLLDGRWEALAKAARNSIPPQLPADSSLATYATWIAAAHEAGLDAEVDQAAKILRAANDTTGIRWRALAVAGRFDEAIEVAKEFDPVAAAELGSTRQRHAEAFEILGIERPAVRGSLAEMLATVTPPADSAGEDRRATATSDQALDRLLAATRLLYMVGDRQTATATLRSIAALGSGDAPLPTARREAALLALRAGDDRLVPELVVGDGDQELEEELSFHLGYLLGDRAPGFFNTVSAAIQRMRPDDSPRERFRAVVDLFAGRLPVGWDRQADLESLHRQLTQAASPDTAAPQMNLFRQNVLIRAAASQPSYLMGDFFARLGRSDLARRAYQRAVEHGDAASLLRLADLELLAGDAAAALTLYETAFENLQTEGSSVRFGFVEPINAAPPSAAAALAGRAVALRRLGKTEQSDALWETLRLAPLNPVADGSRDFVERLGTLEQSERQREAAQAMLRFTAFEREKDRNFYSQAVTHAARLLKPDPAAAAQWMRIAVVGNLATSHLYPSGYLTVPARWHAADALAAAAPPAGSLGQARDDASTRSDAAGREAAAARVAAHLNAALDYYPLNIAMLEEDLPRIREAGFDDLADAAVDRVFATGRQYLEQFGLDANTTNNLAWVTAINDRHYEPALVLARRAVFLDPDNVSYRDTLAELLFRVGRPGEALAIQQQCLLDEPDLWHIHEQIERFRTANRKESAAPR